MGSPISILEEKKAHRGVRRGTQRGRENRRFQDRWVGRCPKDEVELGWARETKGEGNFLHNDIAGPWIKLDFC